MNNRKRRLKLDFRLNRLDSVLIVTVSCLLVFVLVIFHFYTSNVKASQENMIGIVLERMSENQRNHFESYVDEKVRVLDGFVKYSDVYEMDDVRIRSFLRGKAKYFGFEYMFLMKADGTGYYFDTGGQYKDQKDEPFYKDIMEHDVFLTQPFYTDKGPAITTVCVSIYSPNREKLGVLCGALNLDEIKSIVEESEMIMEGSCFIVNRSGNYIASNTDLFLHSEKSIFNEEDSDLALIESVFVQKADMAGNICLKGVEYKAHLTYLEDFDWSIVQCIPTEQITKNFELFEALQGILIVLSAGLILCIVRIIYSWRKSDHKIYADALTGCHSRAACVSLLENLEDQRNMRISIIYMDLNKFKYVNDTFGHDQGDRLLTIFGKTLRSVFGKVGFVGRMGGDEFVAVLSDTNDTEIEKMCKDVEEMLKEQSKTLDFPYVISSSYGYASRNVGQSETMSEIMQQADERMYKNKAAKNVK